MLVNGDLDAVALEQEPVLEEAPILEEGPVLEEELLEAGTADDLKAGLPELTDPLQADLEQGLPEAETAEGPEMEEGLNAKPSNGEAKPMQAAQKPVTARVLEEDADFTPGLMPAPSSDESENV